MNWRSATAVAVIAVLGIAAAAGMGLLANEISGDSIGLSAQPLRAGATLAPAQADRGDDTNGQGGTSTTTTTTSTTETTDDRGGGGGSVDDSSASSSTTTSPAGSDESSGSDDSGFDD